MKVRVNTQYVYNANGYDRFDPKTDLQPGERVIVRNLHGCPPCNTMGCAHVDSVATGKFAGLVDTNSLSR